MYLTPHAKSSPRSSTRKQRLDQYLKSQTSVPTKNIVSSKFATALARLKSIWRFPNASRGMLSTTIGRIILYFVVSTILTVVIFFANLILSIQTVEITSVGNPKIVVQDASWLIGRSILTTSDKSISDHILTANPQFSSVRVTRRYPQTVLLDISEATPVAALYVNDTLYILLTSEGKIVKSIFTKPEKIPVITYYQKLVTTDYELGSLIGYSEIRFATQISHAFLKSNMHDISINISDSAYIEVIRGNTQMLFSAKSDTQKQLGFLPDILKLLQRGTQEYSKIDFRFDKVIVE